MKIAIVCFGSSGGSGVLATELGLGLARKGHQIHFIASEVPFRLDGNWKKNVFYHEVETFDYPLFKYPPVDLSLANKIYDVVMQNNIDIVHCHYAVPHSTSAYIAKKMLERSGRKIKVVTTIHGTDVSIIGTDPTLKDTVAFSLDASDAVTSVSKKMAELAEEVYALKTKPKVIYNFVTVTEPPKPSEDLKEVFGASKYKVITHVSNFRSVKRTEDVVRIFARVNKKIDSKLLLIGDGPEQHAAHKLASKLGLLNKVQFLGLQISIAKLLAITDLFLLPSEKENFSLAALEAMVCGVPVIATNVGGMPEMIDSEVNGYLAEVGDIETMSTWATELLSNPELHAKIALAAKEKIAKNFTPEIIIKQYEEFYANLVK